MRFASYMAHGVASWGVVENESLRDVGTVLRSRFPSLKDVFAANAQEEARTTEAPLISLSGVALLPVIPNPAKILCIGLNYEEHRVEAGREKVAHPAVFTRFADSQIAHGEPIIRPHLSTSLDYEGELAVVIGKAGRYITRKGAMEHIAGYACYNDATIRDWQRHTHQFTPGKNFPGTGGFGPYLVTADEIPDVTALRLTTRLNGEVVQSAGLNQLIFDIPTLVEYCSSFTSLAPGDVIATGTPGGVGFKRTPPLFLKPGDRIEVDIPGVGHLVNGVTDE